MSYGLNWECVSMSFGLYVGKDMMESAAEREAYRRALHALKHEQRDKEKLKESNDIYIFT